MVKQQQSHISQGRDMEGDPESRQQSQDEFRWSTLESAHLPVLQTKAMGNRRKTKIMGDISGRNLGYTAQLGDGHHRSLLGELPALTIV